ncbi:phospholipid hydroperoxide glutathione peroxidase [Tropilaelaps mercedesae]|uniref:Phospholipid hydroperoxide glutathione peroxidase n=1 Tax=Tropilaelaps mercedesae TaxID=418985 RepID=A0A1V9Y3C7_9ACAR|nr:phospholipid hydroperoxide glutathione peroxidase [Tropilaelaps mercedesae]
MRDVIGTNQLHWFPHDTDRFRCQDPGSGTVKCHLSSMSCIPLLHGGSNAANQRQKVGQGKDFDGHSEPEGSASSLDLCNGPGVRRFRIRIANSTQEKKNGGSKPSCSEVQDMNWKEAKSIYEFHALDIEGNDVHLEKYSSLALWKQVTFSDGKYGVNFDMFAKIKVNGEDAHPLWKYLKSKQSGFMVDGIKWNFSKFLIDKKGQPVKRYATTVNPLSMEEDLERYFDQQPLDSPESSRPPTAASEVTSGECSSTCSIS